MITTILCPKCNGEKSGVIDSRSPNPTCVRRRRKCASCGHRFTTYEVLASDEEEAEGEIADRIRPSSPLLRRLIRVEAVLTSILDEVQSK